MVHSNPVEMLCPHTTARYGTLLVRGKQPKPSADGEKFATAASLARKLMMVR
jgi:hypothetical protein